MQSDFEAAEKLFGKERVMGMETRPSYCLANLQTALRLA